MPKRLLRARPSGRQGDPLPAWVGPTLTVYAIIGTLARGGEYVTQDPNSPVLEYVDLIGVKVWGVLFLIGGMFLTFGLLHRWITGNLLLLYAGHCIGALVYAAYSVALAQGAYKQGDGWRFFATAVVAGGLNTVRWITLEIERRRDGARKVGSGA